MKMLAIAVLLHYRSVIIIPEITLTAGWSAIAERISKFIIVPEKGERAAAVRPHQTQSLFAEPMRSNKWPQKHQKGSHLRSLTPESASPVVLWSQKMMCWEDALCGIFWTRAKKFQL